MYVPSYLQLYKEGQLLKNVEKAFQLLKECSLCPRQCAVDRLNNEKGVCQTGRKAKVASYNAHFGEEAPYEISHLGEGIEMEAKDLAAIMITLQNKGCHNINLVTPTHVVPQILEALLLAIEHDLHIPIVYNSGGYERVETLKLLEGIIDIYMPDFKFWDKKWADRYCNAPDYREMAVSAFKEMHAQVGDLKIDKNGIAERGLLVRHLVMPRGIAGTKDIMEFLSKEISDNTYVNVMDQYRPCGTAYQDEYLNNRISVEEYSMALKWAHNAGLKRLDQRQGHRLLFRI
jgi:putative pyruvate formate lyase activating enzyme